MKLMTFTNTYKNANHDIYTFNLLLRQGVCSYEYTDGWEKLNETLTARRFYCQLNMKDITDTDYKHTKSL